MITALDLVNEKIAELLPSPSWFNTPENKWFLRATDDNRLSWTWRARTVDGLFYFQYPNLLTLNRALGDASFIPDPEVVISIDTVPLNKVNELMLIPLAVTRQHCPWFKNPIRVNPVLSNGERAFYRWLVDFSTNTGVTLRRHVLGIRTYESQSMIVISPNGTQVLTSTEDLSYDGE